MTDYGTPRLAPPVIPGRDYSCPQDAYIFTGPIPPPTMWLMGEIEHEDGTTQLIPQPVRWSVLESPVSVDTLAGGLSWTGVMDAIGKGPQIHGNGLRGGRGVPGWAIACVFAGLVLVGLCMVMLSVVVPLMGTR
jgi:hypothetical protein